MRFLSSVENNVFFESSNLEQINDTRAHENIFESGKTEVGER